MRPFDGRRILLVVSGGIAAYKSAHLVRRLQRAGARVDVVLTEGARHFVGPATFEGLTGRELPADLWERPMAHLDLGKAADVAVAAPATADLLSRMAAGRADELATTALLAADCPVVVCPAMNTRMWEHPATRRNVHRLRADGLRIVGPEHGELAEGETGLGRMTEPDEIVAELGRILEPGSPLRGRRVVVTAGPTRTRLDPVRFVSNPSTGRMGYALAASAWRRGAEVVLVTGPGTVPTPHGPRVRRVEESREMLEALEEELWGASALLMAAAVADFEAARVPEEKIRRRDGHLRLELEPGPDLLAETRELREEEGVLSLGFALEVGAGLESAREKLEAKGLDYIALNAADRPDSGFGSATNQVVLLDAEGGAEELPLLPKEEVADRLLDRLEGHLTEAEDGADAGAGRERG